VKPACLTIGGSDSSGGAGIQADLATFAGFDMKGCSAITALTAQNPLNIRRIEKASLAQLEAEIRAVFEYYDVRAVKTGMLVDADRVSLVASLLSGLHAARALVVDPVLTSTSGTRLLDDDGIEAMSEKLFPLATLITPNLPEAEILLGRRVSDPLEDAAEIAIRFRTAVLLKGGHGQGDNLLDVLYELTGEITPFEHGVRNWNREHAHGSGCRLASAIAAQLALSLPLVEAVQNAINWLQRRGD
jgi:hydroxymethylpyrimidine/phosphomethylpyrimidine kinase